MGVTETQVGNTENIAETDTTSTPGQNSAVKFVISGRGWSIKDGVSQEGKCGVKETLKAKVDAEAVNEMEENEIEDNISLSNKCWFAKNPAKSSLV